MMVFMTKFYEMNHGTMPRGKGHWAFCPEEFYSNTGTRDNYLDHTVLFEGTLTEAKRQARKHFKCSARDMVLVICP